MLGVLFHVRSQATVLATIGQLGIRVDGCAGLGDAPIKNSNH